jgi:hypothetical protein
MSLSIPNYATTNFQYTPNEQLPKPRTAVTPNSVSLVWKFWELGVGNSLAVVELWDSYFFSSSTTSASMTSPGARPLPC